MFGNTYGIQSDRLQRERWNQGKIQKITTGGFVQTTPAKAYWKEKRCLYNLQLAQGFAMD